jgi:hypothetical protein
MKSKTLQLINNYHRLLNEQGVDPNAQMPEMDTEMGQGAPPQEPAPEPQEEMPLTSEAEEKYIADLVDAALFEPSAEEARTLLNLQNVMQMKRFTNAREEVLPLILSIISSETQGGDLKKDLNTL